MENAEVLRALCCDRSSCGCDTAARREKGLVHCPAHDDRTPSLSVTVEGDKLLFSCKAGCSQEAVIEALEQRGMWNARRSSGPQRRVTATYPYFTIDGTLLYEVRRFEPGWAGRDKDFRPFHQNGSSNLKEGLPKDIPRILYRLPELVRALEENPQRWIPIPEGEKDSDRLWDEGLVATAYAGGAKAPLPDLEPLRGARVVLIPDADDPGIVRVERDAAALKGIAAEIRIVNLPGLEHRPSHGDDVSDWLNAGHTVEELKALILSTPAWAPDAAATPPAAPTLTLRSIATTPKTWFLTFPDIGEIQLTSEQLISWRRVVVSCLEQRNRHPEYRPRNQAVWEDSVIVLTEAAPEPESAQGFTTADELTDLVLSFLQNERPTKRELANANSPFPWGDEGRIVFRLKQLHRYLRNIPQIGTVDRPLLRQVLYERLKATTIPSFRSGTSVFWAISVDRSDLPAEFEAKTSQEDDDAE